MTEQSATTEVTEAATIKPKLTVPELLMSTGYPEAVFKPVLDKLDEFLKLVSKNNDLVSQINAAKAQDPNDVEYLDSRWKANESDPAIAEKVKEFYAVAEMYEKLIGELRGHAKTNYVKPPLSEDETKEAKKSVAEFDPIIKDSRKALAAMFEMPEQMLKVAGKEVPEGGLVSLLPQAESLKNVRGRKAATAGGISPYVQRVGEILINGKTTNVDGKGKFAYAADKLSEMFGRGENSVTAEEIEEAYFDFVKLPKRSVTATEMPEATFTFEKVTKVSDGQGNMKEVPQKVEITVKPKAKETPATENKEADNKQSATSAPAPTPMKIDTRTEDEKVATAKKTTSAQPKK